jgi:hypothetical protein
MQEHALRMKVKPTCLGPPELSMARRREIHNNSSTVIWGSFEYGGPFDHSALASPFLMLWKRSLKTPQCT